DRGLDLETADSGFLGLSKADIWRALEILVLGVVTLLVLLLVVRPVLVRLLEGEGEGGQERKALAADPQPKALIGPDSIPHDADVAGHQMMVASQRPQSEVEQMIDLNQVE